MSDALLVNGDARMIPLADESVGMILTSPPYNVGLNYEGWNDSLPEDEFRELNRQFLIEAFRVSKDRARAYFILGDKMIWWFRGLAEEIGWTFVQHLIWCKPNMPARERYINSQDWVMMSEMILLFSKGKKRKMLNAEITHSNTFNWFIETVPQSNYNGGRIHPAQLPVSLCMKIIDRTPGEPILDPFAGSGSVLIAAKKLGRPSVGLDIVWSVTKRANKRIRETQPPLFTLQPEQAELFHD